MLFWDSSALVKAYFEESGSPSVLGAISASRGRAFITEYVALEILSVFAKLFRSGKLRARGYRKAVAEFYRDFPGSFRILPVDDAVTRTAQMMVDTSRENPPGAMDILHLASALRAKKLSQARVMVFASSDLPLLKVAAREGLGTFNPEADPLAKLRALLHPTA